MGQSAESAAFACDEFFPTADGGGSSSRDDLQIFFFFFR